MSKMAWLVIGEYDSDECYNDKWIVAILPTEELANKWRDAAEAEHGARLARHRSLTRMFNSWEHDRTKRMTYAEYHIFNSSNERAARLVADKDARMAIEASCVYDRDHGNGDHLFDDHVSYHVCSAPFYDVMPGLLGEGER